MSFVYSFVPSESFYARPFGLTVNIYYRDTVSKFSDIQQLIYIILIRKGQFIEMLSSMIQ